MEFLPWDFVDEIMKYTTIKMGQFDVNYGDAHFRRSDGGMTFYNPFMENNIMDEFATEIGAEVDVHLGDFILVGAVTNSKLNNDLTKIDTTRAQNRYSTVSYTHLDVYKRQRTDCHHRMCEKPKFLRKGHTSLYRCV